MQHVSALINSKVNDRVIKRDVPSIPFADVQPKKRESRGFEFKTLDQLTTDHLSPEDAAKLRKVINGAYGFIDESKSVSGVSFGISGDSGIGKTTVGLNLKESVKQVYCSIDRSGQPVPGTTVEVHRGLFFTAREFMEITKVTNRLQAEFFHGHNLNWTRTSPNLVMIDDVGSEEIDYTNMETFIMKRQSRYREAFDFFYRNNISIIVTSNTPIFLPDGKNVNLEFVNILGMPAFRRLWEMAYPYIYHLDVPRYDNTLGRHAVKSGRGQDE